MLHHYVYFHFVYNFLYRFIAIDRIPPGDISICIWSFVLILEEPVGLHVPLPLKYIEIKKKFIHSILRRIQEWNEYLDGNNAPVLKHKSSQALKTDIGTLRDLDLSGLNVFTQC